MADQYYTMWATPHSLYAGKLRSYLIKKQVPYREMIAADPRFLGEVIGKIGHSVIPVVETPEGELLQDTTAITDHLEAHFDNPDLVPSGPLQKIAALFLDAFGSNYMLPLAMHYRWSYRDQQELFLRTEFARAVPHMDHAARLEVAGKVMTRFAGFLPNLGVRTEVIPAMEESYRELLGVLELHFQQHPYLLGGRASLADFGMMAPLFAHLARDPVPALLMKTTAPSVFRWTERMNSPAMADSDYPHEPNGFPLDDSLPETLIPVLACAMAHWTPGLRADAESFDRWLASLDEPRSGTLVSHDSKRQVHPHVGRISYAWRGVTMERASHPHSLWHVARAQRAGAALTGADAARLAALLEQIGGTELFALSTDHAIDRRNNVLVLA
jgi:glutathione S-transferase